MTECISVSGRLRMELSSCSSSSALSQKVSELEVFTKANEGRQSPTSTSAEIADATDTSSSWNNNSVAILSNRNQISQTENQPVDQNNVEDDNRENTAYNIVLLRQENDEDSEQKKECENFEREELSSRRQNEYNGFASGEVAAATVASEMAIPEQATLSTACCNSDVDNKEIPCCEDDDENDVDHGDLEDLAQSELLDGSLEDSDSSTREGVCGICLETYTQPPRVLNCLHVFCEACLGKQQRPLISSPSRGEGNPGVICCPKCHLETECSQGLKSLPLDYVLINRLDAQAILKRTVICTSCKSEDHAIARCQDCSTFLCSSCRKAHSSMLCFENHQVVSFDAFDQERAQIHRAVSCLRHPREVAQLYDPTCGTAMCNECLVSGHQGHGCKKVNEFDASERADLIALINEAKMKFLLFDETNDSLTASLTELQLTRDSVRSSIEETFITYKSILEKVKATALEELERVHSSQEMRVMDDIQLCQESRVNLEHATEFADKLAKYGDAAEFLALKVLVTSRVRKLIHSCPKTGENADIKFITDEKKFETAVSSLFGDVVTIEPHDITTDIGVSSILNQSVVPEISNTSAVRLLPAELVDAVNASPINSSHYGQLEPHPLLSPPNHHMSSNNGPSTGRSSVLDSIAPGENQFNELRSALAQMNLARLAGVTNVVEPVVEPDVLPLLVGNVGDVVSSGHMIVGPESSRLTSAAAVASDEEAQLINNLSALAKLANPYPNQPMQRFRAPQLSPTGGIPSALGVNESGTVSQPSGSSSTSGNSGSGVGGGGLISSNASTVTSAAAIAGGQRSPTAGVGSMGVVVPNSASAAAVAAAGVLQAPISQGSVIRTNRMTPMHIRIKFGQLGSGQTQFSSPHGFCLGPNEEIVVADTNNHRIQIFDKAGEFKHEFGVQGKDEGQLWYPRKVAVIKSTGTFVICDRGNERSRMQLFTKTGEFMKKIAIRYIDIVAGLALTSDGRIVAVDSVSPTVFVIAEGGDLLLWFDCSEHMREPSDIAVCGSEFYICDFKGHCVVVYSECGNFLRRIGGEGLTNFPNGIDISDHGDILVGDSHGNRFHIVVFNRDGQAVSEFECPYCKVSRCCGLKITSEGYVVTLAKNNHHVLILNTLYIN